MLGLTPWGAFVTLLDKYLSKENKETLKEAGDFIDFGRKAYQTSQRGSVSESAARTLISPMVVFEDSLMHQEYMQDLITIVNLRDIRDTLTHLTLEGQVGGVKIAKLVNSINPNRTAGFMSLQGCEALITAKGSIFEKVKTADDVKAAKKAAIEEKKAAAKAAGKEYIVEEEEKIEEEKIGIDSSEFNNITEYAPLALGRVVKATSRVDNVELNFFLTFRQIPVAASAKDLKLVFSATKKGTGWSPRFKEYKAGGITRPELIRGTDVIKREFNIRNNDMSGYYAEAMKRDRGNTRDALLSGVVSVNTMANTIIMTKDTANDIELEIGMRFNSANNKVIHKYVSANTIVIVNDARGIFEFYTIGDPFPVKYTASQIKTKSKKEDTGSLESLIKLLSGN